MLGIPGQMVLKIWWELLPVPASLPCRSFLPDHEQNQGFYDGKPALGVPLFSLNVQAVSTELPAASQDGGQELMRWGCFPLPHCALLLITKDLASWCVPENKMFRKPSLLAYYSVLRKEAQARSIHPLCRRQMACDVHSSGLFLVRIFQS